MAPLSPAHPFTIGSRFKNHRGTFEVLAIDGPNLRIRWDDGQELITPIEFQLKVLRNLEKEAAPATRPTPAPRLSKSLGRQFAGLQPADFTDDVTGTRWRAREQLGGAVTALLRAPEPFNSWPIYGRPEVHWHSVTRYAAVAKWLQTKFFVQASAERLFFGLYMERMDDPTANCDDWLRFLAWLERKGHGAWLHQVLRATGGAIRNPYPEFPDQALQGEITTEADGTFHYVHGKGITIQPEELSEFLRGLPKDRYVNLVLSQVLARADALAAGVRLSHLIADFFNAFMPVYYGREVSGGTS